MMNKLVLPSPFGSRSFRCCKIWGMWHCRHNASATVM